MRTLFMAGLMACSSLAFAQKKIEKTIPVQQAKKLEMNFEDPKLIKVHTWDKKEILITGSVSINRGENDDAFQLDVQNKNDVIVITSSLRDKENIPGRTVIHRGDQEFYFPTKDPNDPTIRKFLEEHGKDYSYMTNGIIKEITLEIFIPKGMQSSIDAKFGLVEVTNFDAPLTVNAKFGGVDVTVVSSRTGDLIARTRFGEILTNLDVKFNPVREDSHDHWTEIKTSLGNGPSYEFESKFGKVYLRKPQ